jgi:ornithine decarboxylase
MMVHETTELWCEPGRALVAEGSSLLTRVELRKGDALYLNDGSYGALFDATHSKWPFPVKLHRAEGESGATLRPFRFFGPTCDSLDAMPGPFWLPEDVREGDFIEIGMMGAYGVAMSTRFNGFGEIETAEVDDGPMLSLYGLAPRALAKPRSETATVVRLSRARGRRRRKR